MNEKLITQNELDYCIKCGCPKDVCCGQGKISLEWLEKMLTDKIKDISPSHDLGVILHAFKKEIMEAAKKEAERE